MPSYPLHNVAIAIIVGGPFIATCFVALRIYGKRWSRTALALEDYLIILASALSIGLIYPSIRNASMWHIGIHVWDLDQRNMEPNYDEYHKILIAFNLIHTPIIPIVKTSIIVLLLKVGWVFGLLRKVLIGILIFNIGACLGPVIALVFLCPPRTGNTGGPTVYNGLKCLHPRQGQIMYLFLVTVNMFTDLLICPIPTLLMYRLPNISLRARLTVILSFALGLGATAIGAIRFKEYFEVMLNAKPASDWTYSIAYTLNHAENNATIILACMPPLRTYFLRWMAHKDEEKQSLSYGGSGSQIVYGEPSMLPSISEHSEKNSSIQGRNSGISTSVKQLISPTTSSMEERQ